MTNNKTPKEFTHTGIVKDNNKSSQIKLKELRVFWKADDGRKFSKSNGYMIGVQRGPWNHHTLDLSTIKPITQDD